MKIFLLATLLLSISLFAQPKQKLCAVWLTATWRLDWPNNFRTKQSQKAYMIELIDKLKTAYFNTIFFQIKTRGDLMYTSSIDSWAVSLTGLLGHQPMVNAAESFFMHYQ